MTLLHLGRGDVAVTCSGPWPSDEEVSEAAGHDVRFASLQEDGSALYRATMWITFRFTLADGSVVRGPVWISGGFLHARPAAAILAKLRRSMEHRLEEGGDPVWVHPEADAFGSGRRVLVSCDARVDLDDWRTCCPTP